MSFPTMPVTMRGRVSSVPCHHLLPLTTHQKEPSHLELLKIFSTPHTGHLNEEYEGTLFSVADGRGREHYDAEGDVENCLETTAAGD